MQLTFELYTLAKVKDALRSGMWATSLDLSDAPSHPDMVLAEVPVLSGRPKAIHVHGPTIRIDDNAMDVYLGRQAYKEMSKSTSLRTISISRRSTECSRGQKNIGSPDGRATSAVSPLRIVSERGQIRTDPIAVDSVSG